MNHSGKNHEPQTTVHNTLITTDGQSFFVEEQRDKARKIILSSSTESEALLHAQTFASLDYLQYYFTVLGWMNLYRHCNWPPISKRKTKAIFPNRRTS